MAYKDMDVERADAISKINSAGIINVTIENLWRDVYGSMAKGDFLTWNRKLDSIWLILGGEGNSPEKEFNKIDLELHALGSLNPIKKGWDKSPEKNYELRSQQYVKLREKSLFLRKLQNKQGKGTAYVNEDEDDFD